MLGDRKSVSAFYLCPDFNGAGPRVFLLAESKWTSFLKTKAGLPAKPFYTRERRDSEPETHPNGHPWGWLYKPEEALLDERRWLDDAAYECFEASLRGAFEEIKREALPMAGYSQVEVAV